MSRKLQIKDIVWIVLIDNVWKNSTRKEFTAVLATQDKYAHGVWIHLLSTADQSEYFILVLSVSDSKWGHVVSSWRHFLPFLNPSHEHS